MAKASSGARSRVSKKAKSTGRVSSAKKIEDPVEPFRRQVSSRLQSYRERVEDFLVRLENI